MVLALPKASRAGLAWMIWSSRVPCHWYMSETLLKHPLNMLNGCVWRMHKHSTSTVCESRKWLKTLFWAAWSFFPPDAAMLAKYWMTLFVFTVFPAPDSPLETHNTASGLKWTQPDILQTFKSNSRITPLSEYACDIVDSHMERVSTYVIKIDWFSLSVIDVGHNNHNRTRQRFTPSLN